MQLHKLTIMPRGWKALVNPKERTDSSHAVGHHLSLSLSFITTEQISDNFGVYFFEMEV